MSKKHKNVQSAVTDAISNENEKGNPVVIKPKHQKKKKQYL